MAQVDIHDFVKTVRRILPEDKLNARTALLLLHVTRAARRRALTSIGKLPEPKLQAAQHTRRQVGRDFVALQARLDQYAGALAGATPGDPIPEAVAPLYHALLRRHHTPDFSTPINLENLVPELDKIRKPHAELFLVDLSRALKAKTGPLAPRRPAPAPRWPWIVGGVAAGVAVVGVVLVTRRSW